MYGTISVGIMPNHADKPSPKRNTRRLYKDSTKTPINIPQEGKSVLREIGKFADWKRCVLFANASGNGVFRSI